jgi:hypothetical protein|tara:strand:+ start:78 stop:497 length:420 start_codon:yes stop_codon:yes gene_type:complete
MSFLDEIFGSSSSFPDYRDSILYNGHILFKATGKFFGTSMEMSEYGNQSNVILFNTNVPEDKYNNFHNKYELFRFKDHDNFINHGMTNSGGRYLPTGRWFFNDEGKLWEFMLKDDPNDVLFMKMPPFTDDQFYIGKSCL